MRKRIISAETDLTAPEPSPWLPLEAIAALEITSESAEHPFEAALRAEPAGASRVGWRAGGPGLQVIRLRFDTALQLHRIRVVFEETERARSQEFVLRWSEDGGATFSVIVRQQYNFSPPAVTCEEEDYRVDLLGVNAIELAIVPDISGGAAIASLRELRLA